MVAQSELPFDDGDAIEELLAQIDRIDAIPGPQFGSPPGGLAGEAHARSTDPGTSHEAARSIDGESLRISQRAVLDLLRTRGPMPDHDLVELYDRTVPYPQQSHSGIRTRRRELVDAGLVVDTGERVRLPSGRRAIVWAVV